MNIFPFCCLCCSLNRVHCFRVILYTIESLACVFFQLELGFIFNYLALRDCFVWSFSTLTLLITVIFYILIFYQIIWSVFCRFSIHVGSLQSIHGYILYEWIYSWFSCPVCTKCISNGSVGFTYISKQGWISKHYQFVKLKLCIKEKNIKQTNKEGGQSCLLRGTSRVAAPPAWRGAHRTPATWGRVFFRKMFTDTKNWVPEGCITPALISKFSREKLVSPRGGEGVRVRHGQHVARTRLAMPNRRQLQTDLVWDETFETKHWRLGLDKRYEYSRH